MSTQGSRKLNVGPGVNEVIAVNKLQQTAWDTGLIITTRPTYRSLPTSTPSASLKQLI